MAEHLLPHGRLPSPISRGHSGGAWGFGFWRGLKSLTHVKSPVYGCLAGGWCPAEAVRRGVCTYCCPSRPPSAVQSRGTLDWLHPSGPQFPYPIAEATSQTATQCVLHLVVCLPAGPRPTRQNSSVATACGARWEILRGPASSLRHRRIITKMEVTWSSLGSWPGRGDGTGCPARSRL